MKRKRKYYKKSLYMDAYVFAPTGAIQPRERFRYRNLTFPEALTRFAEKQEDFISNMIKLTFRSENAVDLLLREN